MNFNDTPGQTPAKPVSDLAPNRYEKLYRMLLDSIPSSVLLVDSGLRIVSANQNFIQKARVTESQVIGQRLEEVFPPAIYQHMNLPVRMAEVFRTGEARKGERIVYRTPGLSARTYYYSLIPFRWENRTEHVMLLMDDVTEQIRLGEEARRAERHLASVVESANDLVVSTDLKGRVLTWNTAAVRVTGYEEGDVRDRNLCDLCPQGQSAALTQFLGQGLLQGRTKPIELELVRRDGETVPISWVCSCMRDATGRVVGLVAVGRDLTERRQFEAQLMRSEKLAALGVLAGGIAHEIRNPLAVVSTAAQLLLEKPLSREVQLECADKMHRGVQRASNVIESLLRFARPTQQGRKRSLNFVRVTDEALKLVENQLKLEQIQLRARLPDVPLILQGEAGLLQQLVTNLVLNAANAMPAGGGVIEVSLIRNGSQAVLRVTDTGKGIPPTDLPKVFDPFFTTMPVGKGTGLGLSISYAIVQQHEGKIDLISQVGKGTTVTVTLPLEDGETKP
jgi:PAS domain S-box-containing protein